MQFDFPTICFAATRAIHFFACLLILGIWVFDRFVLVSITRPMDEQIARAWRRMVRWSMLIALPAVLISGVAWFGFVTIAMSGLPAHEALQPKILWLVWSQTYFGSVWKWRTIFLVLCAITARWRWIAMIAGILLVGSLAYSGHGQTGLAPGWHLVADMLHVLIASVWPMGLAPFICVLLTLRRSSDPQRWIEAAQITQRFSGMSLAAVGLLIVSGIVNAWCLLGSFNALISTVYGQTLIVKIAIFLAMIFLAAINRLIMKPRLLAHVHPESETARRLQISTAIEFILTMLVLLVTGLLGTLPPARM